MAWMMLILAGIFEVVWAYSMKLSDGFSKLTPSIVTLFFMILSFALLAYAMRCCSDYFRFGADEIFIQLTWNAVF